jgi:CMP-N-acetylneuraminic acid synthetase
VSTDGEKIAKEAEKYGASVHWRADETASDTATSLVAMQEFVRGHAGNSIFYIIYYINTLLLTNNTRNNIIK